MYFCSDVMNMIARDEHLTAGFFKKLALRVHLLMCRHCSRYVSQLKILALMVRDASVPVPASQVESVKARILGQIH